MSLLLDTHALLWWLAGAPIDDDARLAIADPGTLVAVSSATLWEIGIKQAGGKLEVDGPLDDGLEPFAPLAISWAHATAAAALPPHHRDPFDRMLVAQAQLEDLTLVTRDPKMSAYDVAILTC
ncbi:MAG: type II toxin-antitoxin system VapC family toxin [Acidimicrobiales bacterium]